MGSPRSELRKLAARQYGAFSRRQAIGMGVSRHMLSTAVRDGAFLSVKRGVFVVNGAPDVWERRAMVAVLAAGPGAAISYEAAAALHGLLQKKPKTIDVTVPHDRRAGPARRARTLTSRDVRIVRRIPVTCPGRTLVDLASVASDDALEGAIDTALLRGLASISGLRRYIADRNLGSLPGVGRLQRVLADRARFASPKGSSNGN
jgi:predicted transcriptional regulator of viral defense system